MLILILMDGFIQPFKDLDDCFGRSPKFYVCLNTSESPSGSNDDNMA